MSCSADYGERKRYLNLNGISFMLAGDTDRAMGVRPLAQKMMHVMKMQNVNDLDHVWNTHRMEDGTVIRVESRFGRDSAYVYCEPPVGKKKRLVYGEITERIIPAIDVFDENGKFIGIILGLSGTFEPPYRFISMASYEGVYEFRWGQWQWFYSDKPFEDSELIEKFVQSTSREEDYGRKYSEDVFEIPPTGRYLGYKLDEEDCPALHEYRNGYSYFDMHIACTSFLSDLSGTVENHCAILGDVVFDYANVSYDTIDQTLLLDGDWNKSDTKIQNLPNGPNYQGSRSIDFGMVGMSTWKGAISDCATCEEQITADIDMSTLTPENLTYDHVDVTDERIGYGGRGVVVNGRDYIPEYEYFREKNASYYDEAHGAFVTILIKEDYSSLHNHHGVWDGQPDSMRLRLDPSGQLWDPPADFVRPEPIIEDPIVTYTYEFKEGVWVDGVFYDSGETDYTNTVDTYYAVARYWDIPQGVYAAASGVYRVSGNENMRYFFVGGNKLTVTNFEYFKDAPIGSESRDSNNNNYYLHSIPGFEEMYGNGKFRLVRVIEKITPAVMEVEE